MTARWAVALGGLALAAGCQASTEAPSADASSDAEPCAPLCANLAAMGCRPSVDCVEVCQSGLATRLMAPELVACATKAGDPRIVEVCGGGFCR